jgi:hypothetical protein
MSEIHPWPDDTQIEIARQAIQRSGSAAICHCSGEFTSPNGGVKPPRRQIGVIVLANVIGTLY